MSKLQAIIVFVLAITLFIFSFLAVYYAKSSLDYSAMSAIIIYLFNDMKVNK